MKYKILYYLTLSLCFLYPFSAVADDSFNSGSSLENESDIDWSEQDDDLGGEAGSSFEEAAKTYPTAPQRSPDVDVYVDPPDNRVTIVDPTAPAPAIVGQPRLPKVSNSQSR